MNFPDIISLASGYGNFAPPATAVAQAAALLQAGPLPSSPIEGMPSLRAAIAAHYQQQGAVVMPEQVLVTPGAKPALFALFKAALQPGDEVLLPTPNWFGFRGLVEKAGGTLRTLPLDPATDYAWNSDQLQAAIGPQTRILLLSNPNNPTGRVYSRAEWEALLHITRQWPRLLVVSDEIYDGIHFGTGPVTSLLALPDPLQQHVVVSGYSKSLGLLGWSVGYLVAPAALLEPATAWQFSISAAVAALSQVAAQAATEQATAISHTLCAGLLTNREIMRQWLAVLPPQTAPFPLGTYYAFPDWRVFLRPELPPAQASTELAARLQAGGVEVVDGASCGAQGFFRLSYAVPEPLLREALRRIEAVLRPS
ncbi:pyridoxal phosphate-dependent aminotransferase [Hymenobacter cellulosivorans]|uniref:Aminotransferase class I/II-fold pyridoxal phosphate-dependent enzyme n=1 Tax=Hymenobacter cellulosivorans TaxID=2932249 RepID=A0ABY4F8V2_9BACT|nr:aminotransferase class I/II-fold pyridoxal phosphate-dependent enzyme [Hymenobacter cellulosivorans]UOQ52442.1 aminotransferase class I/II-fold pyridoxal phosphate-dependent enzyme [Hymenobacter cellulosivorans]